MLKCKGFRLIELLLLLAASLLLITGCDDDTAPSRDLGDTHTDSAEVSPDGEDEDLGDADITGECVARTDPTGDADQDGLLNAAEDRNLNCMIDAGETDPTNADSDNDGKADGDEDLNGNGIYEPEAGETNPSGYDSNNDGKADGWDSDGDGVGDGDEPEAAVCTREMFDRVIETGAAQASSNLALADGFSLAYQEQGVPAMTFSNSSINFYGATVEITGNYNTAEQANALAIVATALGFDNTAGTADDNLPTVSIQRSFALPSTAWKNVTLTVPALTGVRASIDFSNSASKDLASLRDEIASALSGVAIDSNETGATCTTPRATWNAQLRNNSTLVVTFLLACAEDLDANPSHEFYQDDVYGGTIIAPNSYKPQLPRCEGMDVVMEGGKADFLWVIDNSGSMADEQENVADTVTKFMETLQKTGVDWRIGVTTTEAYAIASEEPSWGKPNPASHDDEIDLVSGIRTSFVTRAELDAADRFKEAVGEDLGCDRRDGQGNPVAPIDSNVCGNGYEDGLLSTLAVVEACLQETRPGHQIRQDALLAIIWVSDEENQSFKETSDNQTLIPQSDPRWTATFNDIASRFDALQHENVRAYAIVGDAGINNGGVCSELATDSIDGAQHGLSYTMMAERFDGATGSICNSDLQETIDRIMEQIIGVAASYPLSGYPIVPSIEVVVDEESVPRSKTSGWDYSADQNAIVFYGYASKFTENSQIGVSYLMWSETGG